VEKEKDSERDGMVKNWEQTRLALYQLTCVPPEDPLVISSPPIGERSDHSRRTPQHKSIDLEKKTIPGPQSRGVCSRSAMTAKSDWGIAKVVALENVPVCFRSVLLGFGADRLPIRNVRREVHGGRLDIL
jgi:hypothetical protein